MEYNWTEFWRQKNEFDKSMDVNYNYFLHRVTKYINPVKESMVLDIGSGPGHLEDAWFDKVKEIHGVDISERYNAAARENIKLIQMFFFMIFRLLITSIFLCLMEKSLILLLL